ncbi:unnamed protein product, partial [Allacma fusca]
MWENALNEGLWDCVFGEDNRELSEECDNKKFDPNGHQTRYQDLGLYFDCMKPG